MSRSVLFTPFSSMESAIMVDKDEKNAEFGRLAVEMNFIEQETLNKAMVVQSRIFDKTNVMMDVGNILMEMGGISANQRKKILGLLKKNGDQSQPAAQSPPPSSTSEDEDQATEGEGTLDIVVSNDRLSVIAHFDGKVPTTEITIDDIKTMLHAEGVVQGIVEEAAIQAFLDGRDAVGEAWIVATGIAPVPEVPAEIVYHFETDPLKVGTVSQEGQQERIDWKERGQLPQVKENELLAELIPGAEGKEGKDVYGKTIPIPHAHDVRFKCGKGAGFSDNGHKIHATQPGTPKRTLTGEISVMPVLQIKGDVGIETGHVEFDGHIDVEGTIEKGYRVKGGSLAANEILEAELEIDGDIAATKGIFGATINCGGNLKANHINNATITAKGDLAVGKEIIDSTLEVNGRVLSYNGVILSSTVSAKMGIITLDIGTPAAKPCQLTVGIDQEQNRKIEALQKRIKDINANNETLSKQITGLKKQSDEINTTLADVAQKQDLCMTTQRQLEKEVDDHIDQGNEAEADALQDRIQRLGEEQHAYDEQVADLLEQDETIGEKLSKLKKTLTENKTELEKLQAGHDKRLKEKETTPGIAVVKISGTLHSGTMITGPNCNIYIDKDRKCLSVSETNKANREGLKPWRFEIGPYQ